MKSPIRAVVTLSDLHLGSTKAILPPGFVTLEENEIQLNSMQKWLWECWGRMNDFLDDELDGDPFALVLNGDMLEGCHHGTKEIWSPEMGDHVNAALLLLEPLTSKAAKTFLTRGTECHTNNHEQILGKVLGSEKCPETGIHSFDRLTLDIAGVRCVWRHHMPTTQRRNLGGTPLSIQLAEEQLQAANNGEKIPRVLGMAHSHVPRYYQDDNGLAFVSPAWQGLTRFGHKVVSPSRCKPGVQILDWRDREDGELPNFICRYYETPQPKAIVI